MRAHPDHEILSYDECYELIFECEVASTQVPGEYFNGVSWVRWVINIERTRDGRPVCISGAMEIQTSGEAILWGLSKLTDGRWYAHDKRIDAFHVFTDPFDLVPPPLWSAVQELAFGVIWDYDDESTD
jgi:hypothetical protein